MTRQAGKAGRQLALVYDVPVPVASGLTCAFGTEHLDHSMKALTIAQPYATLIVLGQKPIENRTWPTRYRGPLAIHAGKSRAWLSDDDDPSAYVFGGFVGVADLVACLKLDATWPARWRHLQNHEHANGPYCWVLKHVRKLNVPVPYRGAQGLFEIDPSILGEL